MGAERRAKVIVEDEDKQPEGQKGTRHRAEIPTAPCGARGKGHSLRQRVVREEADRNRLRGEAERRKDGLLPLLRV